VVGPSPKPILKGVFGTPLFSLRYKVVFGYLGRVFQIHLVKPENKIYKEGGVYNNSKCCYNIYKKKGERWGQNGINKRWDYKYPSLLSSMAG